MEIALRYQALKQALSTLGDGLEGLENTTYTLKEYMLMRDGVIQRFEYCIDSFWKFLKLYLESELKVSVESSAPRYILRLSLTTKIINDEECSILIRCVTDRNLTSHTYNDEIAETIQSHIPRYYKTMQMVVDKLEIKVNAPSQQ